MSSPVKDLKKSFNKLCGPAQFYLGMSLISIVIYLVKPEGEYKLINYFQVYNNVSNEA